MKDSHEVTVCSLPEYENLVAEIYVEGKFIGLLSQESEGQTLLELLGPFASLPVNINLHIFEKALAEAKQRLIRLGKVPPSK